MTAPNDDPDWRHSCPWHEHPHFYTDVTDELQAMSLRLTKESPDDEPH